MIEPICIFSDVSQATTSLREWQERLFLTDWIICVSLEEEIYLDGKKLAGKNEFQIVNKTAVISIVKYHDEYGDCIAKFCNEQTLVHELLHCKYNWISQDSNNVDALYYDTMEHALIEQMAKSLIMAKYDLSFSWFENCK